MQQSIYFQKEKEKDKRLSLVNAMATKKIHWSRSSLQLQFIHDHDLFFLSQINASSLIYGFLSHILSISTLPFSHSLFLKNSQSHFPFRSLLHPNSFQILQFFVLFHNLLPFRP